MISPIRIQLDLLPIPPKRPFWDGEFTWPEINGWWIVTSNVRGWKRLQSITCRCFLDPLSWCFCHASCFCKSFMATEQEKHQRHSFRGACPSLSSFKLFAAVSFVAVEKDRRSCFWEGSQIWSGKKVMSKTSEFFMSSIHERVVLPGERFNDLTWWILRELWYTWICLRCLEEVINKLFPKWWFNGDLLW